MDWKQFVSSIVAALAWPTATVIIVMTLRAPLAKLIPLIRSLKYKDLHIDLGEKLDAVKEKVTAGDEPAPQATPPEIELARISPRAVVLQAWLDVERSFRALASRVGIPANRPLVVIARAAREADAITALEFDTFDNLRRVRNDAVHLSDRDVTFDEAVTMAGMCRWLVLRLDATDSPPADTAWSNVPESF